MVLTWLPCCREKWFHITRLYMVLDHDSKNQEALHVPSSTDRYNNLQCRQAVQTVISKLKAFADFELLECSHFVRYIKWYVCCLYWFR